ncbi:MAG: hypothetical protein ACXVYY_20240 [Oryzihumus sp.]
MLGPLPTKYRLVVTLCALVAFMGLGAWVAYTLDLPVVVGVGAEIGAALGAIAAAVLVHQPHPRAARTRLR